VLTTARTGGRPNRVMQSKAGPVPPMASGPGSSMLAWATVADWPSGHVRQRFLMTFLR